MRERREYMRLCKEYQLQYGPVSALVRHECLRSGAAKNIGSGGLLFAADESLPLGAQLYLRISIPGWKQELGHAKKTDQIGSSLELKTIAEVLRVDYDVSTRRFVIGARFLGQVQSTE